MNAISCDGPGCHFKGADRREFWHFQTPGIDLCLKCANEFNQRKCQIVDEIEKHKNEMLSQFYDKYLAGNKEVKIDESGSVDEEVI